MLNRRQILGGIISAMATLLAGPTRILAASSGRTEFIQQAARMRRDAIASGDQPYGAIVVKTGRIVGLGPSRVVVNKDPTGHAEMEALRDAARNLKTHDLSNCEMYTTSPPCRMCETAAYWANISVVYTGDDGRDLGRPHHGC